MLTLDDDRIEREIRKVLAENEQDLAGMVSPADGRFLQTLVETTGAQRVLEIGTGVGLSGLYLWRGLAATGGQLVTIEAVDTKVEKARASFDGVGCGKLVNALEGEALEFLQTFAGDPNLRGPYDIVFSDAAKGNNLLYFDAFMPLVRPGGLIVAHDALCKENRRMRDYLDMLRAHPGLRTSFLSTETCVGQDDHRGSAGLAISQKLTSGFDNVPRWSWHGRKVVALDLDQVPCRRLPYTVREAFSDDFGGASGQIQVAAGSSKEDVVGLLRAMLRERNQPHFAVHVYDSGDAFENRNNFDYPNEEYFGHLIAQAYRHPALDRDEIYWHPEKAVLLLAKHDIEAVPAEAKFGVPLIEPPPGLPAAWRTY